MAVENYVRFYQPVLVALRALGGSARPHEVKQAVIEAMNLDEADLQRVRQNGGNAVENEIAWARNTLRLAGLIDGSESGVWRLTDAGMKTNLTLEEARALRLEMQRARAQRKAQKKRSQIESAKLEFEVAEEESGGSLSLLEVLQSLTPAGFERFCQHLLRVSGFSEVHVSGRSGDGGIDGNGILQVNELVSFRVLFQCKRYQGTISPDQIRDFRGAMQGRTDKGIYITTGSFTPAAEKEAVREGAPPIELVNGDRLVALMERLELGVIPRIVYDVDHEFFKVYN